MKKLNAIAAAAGAVATAAEMEAIQREAALKMPIKNAMRELHAKLRADLDAALEVAIERYLGHPLEDPEIIRGRLHVVLLDDGDTYSIDGRAILWAGPIGLEREGEDTMRVTQTLKHL